MINIVLADDHHIVRKGLSALLSCEADFQIVGEAGDGIKAVALINELKPDIAVLDLMMPGLNGLEVTAKIAQKDGKPGIVILSMLSNEAYIHEALRAGARAYILKDNSSEELITAVREVSAGRTYLGSSLPEGSILKDSSTGNIIDPLSQVTPRENEIMRLAVAGKSNSEIAAEVGISQRTVETHCTTLMRKLSVTNRHGLIHFAIQRGVITTSEILGDGNYK